VTQYAHLAQLHFTLTTTQPDTLPALLFKKLNAPFPLLNLHPTTLDYHIHFAIHEFNIGPHPGPLPHMASKPPENRERAFGNMLQKNISNLWTGQLHNAAKIPAGHLTGRKASGRTYRA